MGLVSGETGRGTFVREISLPYGHGIDQHAVANDVLDLNFNYPSLPGQGELLREALRQVAASGDMESHLRYQPHAGRMTEREIIAAHITEPGFQPEAMSDIFEENYRCYGYQRLHAMLRGNNRIISEKVVRRLMAEEQLVVKRTRRRYSSYCGEIGPAPEKF